MKSPAPTGIHTRVQGDPRTELGCIPFLRKGRRRVPPELCERLTHDQRLWRWNVYFLARRPTPKDWSERRRRFICIHSGDPMTKYSLSISAVFLAVSLAAPHLGGAQTFKVARFSIGGEGGTDYLTAEPGTGRVFVSRGTHVMVIDGRTGKVIGDIPDTPRTHGIALAPKSNHGFITNGGDSTVTMFDLKTLVPIKKIRVPSGGLDGIMYDDFSDRIILTNHSRPIGTAT